MRRILLFGANGQVARELRVSLAPLGELVVVARHGTQVTADFAAPESVAAAVQALRPDWIVNASAYTAVDRAESESELAMTINGTAVGALAAAARACGALLVHYSTDFVFDGQGDIPRREDDQVAPLNTYGRTKRAGEEAILAAGGAHLIFRTEWVYGLHGANFMRTMRRLARERAELRVVADQIGAPTWSRDIANATALVLAQLGDDRARWQRDSGLYNLTSAGRGSWFEFAEAIIDHQRSRETLPVRAVLPISSAEYPVPARRPAFSVLDGNKLAARFSVRLPDWRDALAAVQRELDSEPL